MRLLQGRAEVLLGRRWALEAIVEDPSWFCAELRAAAAALPGAAADPGGDLAFAEILGGEVGADLDRAFDLLAAGGV